MFVTADDGVVRNPILTPPGKRDGFAAAMAQLLDAACGHLCSRRRRKTGLPSH